MNKGVLTFFCGKMGAGKSTKSSNIAVETNAVLLSEDEWLESLYPNKVRSLDSYIEYSNLIRPQMKKLVQSILSAGTDIVMDFPANTVSQRDWFRDVFSEIEAPARFGPGRAVSSPPDRLGPSWERNRLKWLWSAKIGFGIN